MTSDSVNPYRSSEIVEKMLFTLTLFIFENMPSFAICRIPVTKPICRHSLSFRAAERNPDRNPSILLRVSASASYDTGVSYSSTSTTVLSPLDLNSTLQRKRRDERSSDSVALRFIILSNCSTSAGMREFRSMA